MVLHNGDLNMVTWEQRISAGDPKFEDSQVLPRFAFAEYARMLGLHGIKVERPDAIGAAWDQALSADRPTLLEVITDPNVPPVPPHVSQKQVRHYLSAIAHGDPQAIEIVIASAKEWWDGMLPPGKKGR